MSKSSSSKPAGSTGKPASSTSSGSGAAVYVGGAGIGNRSRLVQPSSTPVDAQRTGDTKKKHK